MGYLRKERGITLIALIVTIVILLILAAVATYSGVGVIRQSKLNTFITEMKIMQTEVNKLYDRYASGEEEVLGYGVELDSQADKVFTTSASGITDKDGYRYYNQDTIKGLGIEGVESEFFVNVSKRSVVSYSGFEYEGVIYYTLEQLPQGVYNVEYENKNAGKPTFDLSFDQANNGKINFAISNVEYTTGYINKWEVKYQLEGRDYWSTSEDLSFFVDEFGKYKIKIVNGSIESDEKEIEIKAVAQIGNQKYISLEKAVKAVGTEETEILMVDNTEEDVTFPEGKTIILNLADKTITGNQTNAGTLTIKGEGVMQTGENTEIDDVIENSGILNINEGTLKSTAVSASRAIYNLPTGTVNMNGGMLVSQNQGSWTVINLGVFNLKGGTISLTRRRKWSSVL